MARRARRILMSVLRTQKLREIHPIEWLRKKMVHLNPPILC
jgi:hypothetical protein